MLAHLRSQGPSNLVIIGVAALVVIPVVVAVTPPISRPGFMAAGHWVFNKVAGAVLHIHGGTMEVDAKVPTQQINDGRLIISNDSRGYVVDGNAVVAFGTSRLTVENSFPVPSAEEPIGLEIPGGPYLVYREAGTVIRLGQSPTTIQIGGPVHTAVGTEDGTIWLQRTDSRSLCELARDSLAFNCGIKTAPAGSLAVVRRQVALVEPLAGTMAVIRDHRLGEPMPLLAKLSGDPAAAGLSADTKIATNDADGRLPMLDPATSTLVLADTSWVADPTAAPEPSRTAGPATIVKLKPGAYKTPVAAQGSVAVVEVTRGELHTFGSDGKPKATIKIPDPAQDVTVSRGGDGRVYVDNTNGTHTLVVNVDGAVTNVDTTKAASVPRPSPSLAPPDRKGVPSPPRTVSAQPGNAQVKVSWTAAEANGSPITGYEISWTATNGGRPGQRSVPAGQRAVAITGLVNGGRYVFSVAARNALGLGQPAVSRAVTPSSSVPSPPASVRANATPDGAVAVNWPPANGQGNTITGYQVSATGSDGSNLVVATIAGTGTAATVNRANGLVLGVSYTFTVTSTNNLGLSSEPSSPSNSVRPYAPADAPRNVAVNGGDGIIDVTWTAPPLNGGTLVEYVVSGAGLPQQTVSGTTVRFSGLANGTDYRVDVRARTRGQSGGPVVDGAPASASGRPGTVPSVVLNSVAQAGDRAGMVRVSVNGRNSGPVTCQLIFNGAQRWSGPCSGTQDIVVSGLNYATDYDVYAQPSNAYGNGPVSAHLGFRTNDPPPPPPRVTVSKGAPHTVATCTGAACAWVNITADNLSPNTSYTVICRASNGDEGGWWTQNKTTDGAGHFAIVNSGCIYGFTGRDVWATAGPHESNHMRW